MISKSTDRPNLDHDDRYPEDEQITIVSGHDLRGRGDDRLSPIAFALEDRSRVRSGGSQSRSLWRIAADLVVG